MATPTHEEVANEIKALKEVRKKMLDPNSPIPASTFFGDSNVAKVDAAIWVLEEVADEDDIYYQFEDGDDPDSSQEIIHAALQALQWRDDEWDGNFTEEEKRPISVGWLSYEAQP